METPEEKLARNERVKARDRRSTHHEVWVTRVTGLPDMEESIPPKVVMSNVDDGFYSQNFNSRSEVESFIEKLQGAADEAWPKGSLDKGSGQE